MQPDRASSAAKIKRAPWYSLALLSASVGAAVLAEPWSWSEPWYVLGILLWGVWFAASLIGLMLELDV